MTLERDERKRAGFGGTTVLTQGGPRKEMESYANTECSTEVKRYWLHRRRNYVSLCLSEGVMI